MYSFRWYLSLNTMLLSHTQAAVFVLIHFWLVFHCVNVAQVFICSPVGEDLSFFQVGAIMVKLLQTFVFKSLCISSFLLGKYRGGALLDNLAGGVLTVFQNDCTIFIPSRDVRER